MDGELADVVRGGASNDAAAAGPEWQFSSPYLSSSNDADFGDPFSNLRDPLLHELDMGSLGLVFKETSTTTNTTSITTSGGASFTSDMVRSCGGDSKVLNLQISPAPRNPGGGEAKRRKNQAKKVICIPAPAPANSRPSSGEVVPSDLWAWRKYGQKPIKGSPYPRGYYRCSSSKCCSARKQVERSRNDPNMLVITYTSEHNHPWPTQRNALAGSTRTHPLKNPNPKPLTSSSHLNPKNTVHEEQLKDKLVDEVDEEFPRQKNTKNTASSESTRHDDMFSNLGEIEVDPMNAMRGKHDNNKSLDPLTLLDWTASNCLRDKSS